MEKRFQGHTVDTPLTPKGLEQAKTLGRILRINAPDPATLSYVSSPLHRAQHTMQIVLEVLGFPTDSYTTDPRLIEIDLGAWDGLTAEEAKAQFPEAYAARQKDKWNVDVPGGENYASVARRATSFAMGLKTDAFAVSHGAFTRILRGLFLGLTWQQMSDLDEPQGVIFRVRESTVERLN